jgi:head-tail adaptor
MARLSTARYASTILFERNTAERTGLGGKALPDWEHVAIRKAAVTWGSSAERRSAAVERAVQTATFRVRADAIALTINPRNHRIVLDGLAFDITGIVPIGAPRPNELEITGMASRG